MLYTELSETVSKEPICDAVVKLTEVAYDCGKEIRKPIGHTFTDKEGEFVFGPLCPDRHYAIQIWANATKKKNLCKMSSRRQMLKR